MNHPGVFLALEGSDGAGKSTQLKLVSARIKSLGYDVETFEFPRYSERSSYFVQNYLKGHYGPAAEVNPYTASFFYALDRYEAAPKIRQALKKGKVVVADRFVASNMAHQGSKFANSAQKRGFFLWADQLEYELLGIPRPDKNLYLHLPTKVAKKLIEVRSKKAKRKADEHEKDSKHLENTTSTYELLCQLFPKDFIKIDCSKDGKLLSITTINDLIWQAVKPLLPPDPPNLPKSQKIETK